MAAAPGTPQNSAAMMEIFGVSPPGSGAITVASTSPPNRGGGIPASSDDELARAIADEPGQSSLLVRHVATTTVQPSPPAKRRATRSPSEDINEQARQLDALRNLLCSTYAERCQAEQQKEWLLSKEFQQRCAEAENIIQETRAIGAEEMLAQSQKFHSLLQAFKEHKEFEQSTVQAEMAKLQEQYKTEIQAVKETADQKHREVLGAEQLSKEQMKISYETTVQN